MNPSDFVHRHGRSHVAARLTPWDKRALGFGTAELTSIQADTTEEACALLEQAETWARQNGVDYLFGRVPAEALLLRLAMEQSGHTMVECSLTLSRDGFAGLPVIPARMRPRFRLANHGDLPTLQAIAHEDFHHGRLLEDPAIARALAARRTVNWVSDLLDQGLLQTVESNGKVIGFHAERLTDEGQHANLILTGATRRYAVLALPLWICALERLGNRQVKRCSTLVSAANVGVINLYAKLGFRYDTTLFGYRKFL